MISIPAASDVQRVPEKPSDIPPLSGLHLLASQALLEPLASYFMENTEMPLTLHAHIRLTSVCTSTRVVLPPIPQVTSPILNFEI